MSDPIESMKEASSIVLSRLGKKPADEMTTKEIHDFLAAQFIRVADFLKPAIEMTDGCYDTAYVWDEIEAGRAQLWWGKNSALVTRIETYATGKRECVGWLAGGELEELIKIEEDVSRWAKSKMGCSRFRIVGRRGWLKALKEKGYQESFTVMSREI